MSVFLERQKVRKRKAIAKSFRVAERILFSLVIVLGGLAILYGIYLLVFLGPAFSVREIIVEGKLVHSTLDGVARQSGIKEGENLFAVNVGGVHKNLKENSWISRAAVRRRLPHAVWIYIEEFDPAAVIEKDGVLKFVDHEAVVFKSVEPADPKTLPVITGVNEDRMKEALELLSMYNDSSLGGAWGMSELHWDDARGYSIMTEKGPVEIFLGQDAIARRLDLLGRWLGIIGRHGGRITYIIANEDKRVTVGYRDS